MDVVGLLAAERIRLAHALDDLSAPEWETDSLCAGWSARVVAAHLNAPWGAKAPLLASTAIRERGNVASTLNALSMRLADRIPPAEAIAGLRLHADHHFPKPWPLEAPLTDVVVHGADILTPLDRSVDVAPAALTTVLTWLSAGAMRAFLPKSRLAGLELRATDLDASVGTGSAWIEGPALALCGALLGRRVYFPRLTGPGVAVLDSRL